MRVVNCHKRVINQSIISVSELFETLATSNDKIWPSKNWPSMRFKNGIKVGEKGGHGIIKYTVMAFEKGSHVKFRFSQPKEFVGTHELTLMPISDNESEIQHIIKMRTDFRSGLFWIFVIRWLHNALIEEAFDNVENHFSEEKKSSKYNLWVRLLRKYYKGKKKKPILSH